MVGVTNLEGFSLELSSPLEWVVETSVMEASVVEASVMEAPGAASSPPVEECC